MAYRQKRKGFIAVGLNARGVIALGLKAKGIVSLDAIAIGDFVAISYNGDIHSPRDISITHM
jgi:hypothetical protein